MDDIVQSILEENDLVIKQIPEGPYSLMRAISNCLYFSSINYKQIQEQCIRFLKQMIDQKKLPEKLNQFKNSITLFNDFILDPNKFDYHKVNLELVSLLFQTKIQVYYINEENQLLSFIINNRYKRKIEMVFTNNHYDPLFSRKFMQLVTISQQIVQKIIDQSLDINIKQPEKYVNYEYEHWFEDRIQQLHENNSTDSQMVYLNQSDGNASLQQPRFKRSLSDNFNINHLIPQDDVSHDIQQQPPKYGIIEENDESSNQNDSHLQIFEKDDNSARTDKIKNKQDQMKRSQQNSDSEGSELRNKQEIIPNTLKEKNESLFTPKLDILSVQTLSFERRPIISPIYFVKSTPPGISPKPNMNSNNQKFDWKNQEDSNEDSIIEEKSNGNEMSAQNSLNSNSQSPPSKRGSGKFNAGSMTNISPTKLKGEKDAPLSQFALKKPKIVELAPGKVRGSLKFFDEKKNYGFFVVDEDGSDIFVHFDDLEKAGVTKDVLKESVEKKIKLQFIFNQMVYVGKYKESKKAIDIEQVFDEGDQTILTDSINPTDKQDINQDDNSNLIAQNDINIKQSSSETQILLAEQKKKQFTDRFAGFSSIIAASQKRKSQSSLNEQSSPSEKK